MTAILRDASGKMHHGILFDPPLGLALKLEVNLPFLLCFTLNLRAIFQVQAPGGGGL